MIRAALLAASAASALAAAALAEPIESFDQLQGGWRGPGTFQGAPVNVSARFAPALSERWRQLEISYAAADGEAPPFSGRGHYLTGEDGAVSGRWLDSLGANFALDARFEDGALVVDWGDDAARGFSRYSLSDAGDLRVEDFFMGAEGPVQFADATLMRARSPREVVEALFEAFNARDADALAALYAEDAVVLGPDHPPLTDRAAIRANYQELFDALPSAHDEVTLIVADDDAVSVEFTASWDTPDGRASLSIAAVIEVRDGLIVRDAAYFDRPEG